MSEPRVISRRDLLRTAGAVGAAAMATDGRSCRGTNSAAERRARGGPCGGRATRGL